MTIEAGQGDEAATERERPPHPRRLSEVFMEIAENATGPITIGAMIDILGDRSFAALLLFFAALNLLPLPPGATLVLGLPLIIIAAQMIWGSPRVWMPRVVREKSFTAEQFRSAVAWVAPRLTRLEKLVKPRYWPFWPKQGERVVGVLALILGIVVTLPIPLGNWFPAFAIAIMCLALSERDGIVLAIGTAIGVMSLLVVTFLVGSATLLANMLWHKAMLLF